MSVTPQQRQANRRLGWILLTVALMFALGFVLKIICLGR